MRIIYILIPICSAYFNRYLYNFYSSKLQHTLRYKFDNKLLYKNTNYNRENFIYFNKIVKKKNKQNILCSILSGIIFLKCRNISIIIIAILNYILLYKFKNSYSV